MGAGAVGSYFGGRLAAAGHDVTLVARPPHVAAIQKQGLIIDSKVTGRTVCTPKAVTSLSEAEAPEFILLAVKSYDTRAAAEAIAAFASDAPVITVQNGISNHRILAEVLGDSRAFPGVVYAGVGVPSPGVVEHKSRGEIILPRMFERLQPAFESAGVPATITDNIEGFLWGKFLLNASCNALSMLAGATFGALAADTNTRDVIRASVGEILRLAHVWDIDIPLSRPAEQILQTAESLSSGYSSMHQDFHAGKRLEIDALNGEVVRLGREADIPTPVNLTLYAAVSLIDRSRHG